jgi:hypothetical protein
MVSESSEKSMKLTLDVIPLSSPLNLNVLVSYTFTLDTGGAIPIASMDPSGEYLSTDTSFLFLITSFYDKSDAFKI